MTKCKNCGHKIIPVCLYPKAMRVQEYVHADLLGKCWCGCKNLEPKEASK